LASSLKKVLGLTEEQYAAADPNELAALRQRWAVQPDYGRQEGATTRFIENYLPVAWQLNEQMNPINLLSLLARHTTGDLLFPLERAAKERSAKASKSE
jgi:hypothetical protein